MAEQYSSDVLQPGKRELRHRGERCVLNAELPEPRQPPEGEGSDGRDVVAVQRQLAEVAEPCERVAADHREVVLGEREVLDGGGQHLERDLGQTASVAEDLRQRVTC